jgi:small-conductance mechanosensitive channel
VWTRDYASRPGALRSELNFAILAALREAGIEIPFPQRDVRVRMVSPS